MGYPRFGMIDLLKLLGGLLVGLFRARAAREAEMAFLRQRLVVLQRSAPTRLRLGNADRLIFVWLYRRSPLLLVAAAGGRGGGGTAAREHRQGMVRCGVDRAGQHARMSVAASEKCWKIGFLNA
jgi:hypothetical protein